MKFVEFTLNDKTGHKIMVDVSLILGLEEETNGCVLFVTIGPYKENQISIKESYEQASALLRSI